eukprot:CAMPEP_0172447866 /NCGR_PEP_ID=MMETSP1065-20121228/7039_1 /TAXON_ID=265537 /ORGANISM="Amphiprora paludosa, Strain CCMP125" /LENGTH=274 /DNA_ID=CAMNT_0013199237 /DNA_START=22 /DNA_END=846 /DNA_ORIENTATION=-
MLSQSSRTIGRRILSQQRAGGSSWQKNGNTATAALGSSLDGVCPTRDNDGHDTTAHHASLHTIANGGNWNEAAKRNQLSLAVHSSSLLASSSQFSSPLWQPQHQRQQVSQYHTSTRQDRAAAIMLGFGCLAAVSFAGAQGVKAYNEWKASIPEVDEEAEKQQQEAEQEKAQQQQAQQQQAKSEPKKESASGSRENVFKEWFGVGVGSKYYEGGFEDSMTRREAALILGVRESSPASRIKDAHRKLLILNHPDTGGSTYMAGKINEAKELLMKGK